ncbi:FtsX-like permease family protein [Clostridium butyricum]
MIIDKRIPREFTKNITKYIGLFFLIIISSTLVVSYVNSADSILQTGAGFSNYYNQEDGEFEVKNKLNQTQVDKIHRMGIILEENFYIDYDINDSQTIRLFKNRININKISLIKGTMINNLEHNNIVLDEKFAMANNYLINSSIKINNKNFNIIGYGATPDYTFIIKQINDIVSKPNEFGIGFIDADSFNNLHSKKVYCYSYKLNGIPSNTLKSILEKNSSITSFLKVENNPRATSYIDDIKTTKQIGIFVGLVLFIMIAFIVSMSLINNIDQESTIIGTLYSLGYLKKEILKHYLKLPILLVSIGSIVGTILGFFFIKNILIEASTVSYSFPKIFNYYSISILITGIVFPVLIVMLVNYFVLSKRLNSSPLNLLRKEKKQTKLKTIKISYFSFITKFKLTQFIREIRSTITLILGIFISVFLLIYGLCIDGAFSNYLDDLKTNCSFEYMYTLKMPIEIIENKNIEKFTIKGLSIYYSIENKNIDISLQGIQENSEFHNFSIPDSDNGLYVSDSLSKKLNIKIGDTICLKDTIEDKIYNLKVAGIVKYSTSLSAFMNQKQLNMLFDKSNSYFNGYFSNKKLNINEDYVYSLVTKNDIINSAILLEQQMTPIVYMTIVSASILFMINMYLLLKMLIDKNVFSISLVKVLGYRNDEINKLYLGSSFYTTIITTVISFPLSKYIVRLIWPYLTSNFQTYFDIVLFPKDYILTFTIIFTSYFVSISFLKKYINKVSLANALKERD